MTEIFYTVLFSSLFVLGIHTLFSSGFLLEKIGWHISTRLPQYLADPLVDCLPCMSSTWGIGCLLLLIFWPSLGWILAPIAIVGLGRIFQQYISR